MKPHAPMFATSFRARCDLRKWAKCTLLIPLLGSWACGYGDHPNPPPLHNREGYPSRGPVTAPPSTFPKQGENGMGIDEPDVRAHLQPIAPAQLDVRANLKQVGHDVLIAVKVSGGPPGEARVTVDRQSCDRVATGARGQAHGPGTQASQRIGVGEFTVNENGIGELVTSIEGMKLSGDEGSDSLVGTSLVVYQSGKAAHAGDKELGLPLACTQI